MFEPGTASESAMRLDRRGKAIAMLADQMDEVDRIYNRYPHLNDNAFAEEHLDRWMAD